MKKIIRKAKLEILLCCRLKEIAIIMYKAKYIICPPFVKDPF